ncbi:hypothetical protein M0802_011321 [Mischocyttarus mexicanus]|nr:hypothetical protein M0802_011321 [Mischocyttarus mexicanus]
MGIWQRRRSSVRTRAAMLILVGTTSVYIAQVCSGTEVNNIWKNPLLTIKDHRRGESSLTEGDQFSRLPTGKRYQQGPRGGMVASIRSNLLDPNVDHLVRVKALKTLTRHSAEALLMFSASTERVQKVL